MGKAVLNRTGRRYDRDMRSRASLFALLFVVGFFVLPQFAHASIPFFGPIVPNATCPAGWGMIITVINNVIEFLLTLAIVFVAPLSIAYAGFLFVVNPVNAGGKEQAKKILTNTIVGIVIALAGWMIVDAVMAVLYNPGNVLGTWSSIINSGGAPVCLTQAGSAPGAGFAPAAPTAPSSGLAVTGASGENITQAVNYLDASAQPSSTGQCALYVRQALAAGGLTSFDTNHPANAYQYGPYLTSAGFTTVSSSGYTPQTGDVIVFQPVAGHPSGHIEMYDGSQWVSDFKQKDILPTTDYQGGSYTVYRA